MIRWTCKLTLALLLLALAVLVLAFVAPFWLALRLSRLRGWRAVPKRPRPRRHPMTCHVHMFGTEEERR